jgi:glycosyltransferase involved in cell wall biosynthesis
MAALPKISCLTVTTNRLILLKQAIDCYCDQTYPNREMVIVSAGTPRYLQAILSYVKALGRSDIRVVDLEGDRISLGHLRNVTLDNARGEILCQWDDDDLYHPDRIQLQYDTMVGQDAGACFMTCHLQYFVHEQNMFWIDWRYLTGHDPEQQMVPMTVMARMDSRYRYNETGHDSETGEDNHFRLQVHNNVSVAPLHDHGYLYLYRFHGRNTTPEYHHANLYSWGTRETGHIRHEEAAIRRALAYYRLPMPYNFKGRDGEIAMVFHGRRLASL